MTTMTTREYCARCGMPTTALVHNATANGHTFATSAKTCPPWCVSALPCRGDHFANPGGEAWPGVNATGSPEQEGPLVAPAPTWGAFDGLAPAVVLYIYGGSHELDASIDLRPDEARRLAEQLVRAAEAAQAG